MAEIKKGKFCHHCKRQMLHTAKTANHLIHFLMTLLTFGCWTPIWMWAALLHGAWLCSECGTKYHRGKARRAAK